MKKLKWWHWLLILIAFSVVGNVFFGEEVENAKMEKEKQANATHELSKVPFDSMTIEQKTKLAKLFLDGNKKPFDNHRHLLTEQLESGFEKITKFPETLEYQYGLTWNDFLLISSETVDVLDIDKGTYRMANDYKAENNFGQKVRSSYQIDFKYNGKRYEITDAKFK